MAKHKKKYGKKVWALSAGHIPLFSSGHEPEFTSHDKIAILNTSHKDAHLKIDIYYEDSSPVGKHEIEVKAQRMRKVRFNDLIDPLPIPLDKPFGFVIRSNVNVIVQFSRLVTSGPDFAGFCVTPFHVDDTQ